MFSSELLMRHRQRRRVPVAGASPSALAPHYTAPRLTPRPPDILGKPPRPRPAQYPSVWPATRHGACLCVRGKSDRSKDNDCRDRIGGAASRTPTPHNTKVRTPPPPARPSIPPPRPRALRQLRTSSLQPPCTHARRISRCPPPHKAHTAPSSRLLQDFPRSSANPSPAAPPLRALHCKAGANRTRLFLPRSFTTNKQTFYNG